MLKINIEEVIKAIESSKCIAEVNEKIGYERKSSSGYRRVKNIIKQYKIDTTHFTGQHWSKGTNILTNDRLKSKHNKDEIFIENSKVSRSHVKTLILKNKLIPYICSECNLTNWRGKELSLDLEHKNGIRNDNRLENLTFLCPNCHSITETYKGKNKKSKLPVPKERVLEVFKESKSIREILIKLNLAAEGGNYDRVRKLLKENNLTFVNSKFTNSIEKTDEFKTKRLNCCLMCGKPAINKYCSYKCTHSASKKVDRPSKEELSQLVSQFPVTKIAENFGVTSNSVKKWCKVYNINLPPLGYWRRIECGYSHEESLISQKRIQKPAKRFTDEQLIKIRELILENKLSLREIGNIYNVSHATISDIKNGYTYTKNFGKLSSQGTIGDC